jgi:ribosomal protein S18 acetylase RimI-like enzyme
MRLIDARDLVDFGECGPTRVVVGDMWRARDFDPAVDAVVLEAEDGWIAGYAMVYEYVFAFVDPEREGRGLGRELLSWTEQRACARGRPSCRQAVPVRNDAALRLLGDAGYRSVRTLYELARELNAERPAPASVPHGIALASLDVEANARALHAADAVAFAVNADYEPATFEQFCDEHLASPDLDPSLSAIAWSGDAVAGFTVCRRLGTAAGYIDLLAVDPLQRRRGLGMTLLTSAFEAFARAGLREARLNVVGDNPGALRLYRRAGMTVRREAVLFEKAL